MQEFDPSPLNLLDACREYPKANFVVSDILGDDEISYRLREIGLRKGQTIKVKGRAPFFGPYYLYFMNSFWALRSEEMSCIFVTAQELI